jgi:hypothetical protein
MRKPTAKEISQRLVNEFGYSRRGSEVAAAELAAAHEKIQTAFLRWWQTGEITKMEVEGYTAQRLIQERHMKPVAAFLTLDWLLKEPAAALKALARPYDVVVF